jgi:hypothetical protein
MNPLIIKHDQCWKNDLQTNYGKACSKARFAVNESLYGMSRTMGCGPSEQSQREFGSLLVTPEWLKRTREFFKKRGYEFIINESTMNDTAYAGNVGIWNSSSEPPPKNTYLVVLRKISERPVVVSPVTFHPLSGYWHNNSSLIDRVEKWALMNDVIKNIEREAAGWELDKRLVQAIKKLTSALSFKRDEDES